MLIFVVHLIGVAEEDGHSPPLGLQLGETYQREIQPQERPHLPDLEGVVGRYLAQEGDPVRLALPMELNVEVWDEL